MRLPQFRLRSLLIAIAVLAPVLLALIWLYQINTALEDFYGPTGKFAMEQQIADEISAGSLDLALSRFVDAEARYRSALGLNEQLVATMARHGGWSTDHSSGEIAIRLAEALMGQRRDADAESLYESILRTIAADDRAMVDVLENYAALERQMGNLARERDLLERARVIRENARKSDQNQNL